jgi:hypothetical protein
VAELDPSRAAWHKSAASESGGCVEVAFVDSSVLVRNSRNPFGPVLTFTPKEWIAFITGSRNGEFDLPVAAES